MIQKVLLCVFALGILSSSFAFADGATLYKNNCATCHGDKGDGMGPAGQYLNPKPRNFVADKMVDNTAAYIEKVIEKGFLKDGKPTTMVAFPQIKPADRKAIADYVVKTFKPKK